MHLRGTACLDIQILQNVTTISLANIHLLIQLQKTNNQQKKTPPFSRFPSDERIDSFSTFHIHHTAMVNYSHRKWAKGGQKVKTPSKKIN